MENVQDVTSTSQAILNNLGTGTINILGSITTQTLTRVFSAQLSTSLIWLGATLLGLNVIFSSLYNILQTAHQNDALKSKFKLLFNALLLHQSKLTYLNFILSKIPTKILNNHVTIIDISKKISLIISTICDILCSALETAIKRDIERSKMGETSITLHKTGSWVWDFFSSLLGFTEQFERIILDYNTYLNTLLILLYSSTDDLIKKISLDGYELVEEDFNITDPIDDTQHNINEFWEINATSGKYLFNLTKVYNSEEYNKYISTTDPFQLTDEDIINAFDSNRYKGKTQQILTLINNNKNEIAEQTAREIILKNEKFNSEQLEILKSAEIEFLNRHKSKWIMIDLQNTKQSFLEEKPLMDRTNEFVDSVKLNDAKRKIEKNIRENKENYVLIKCGVGIDAVYIDLMSQFGYQLKYGEVKILIDDDCNKHSKLSDLYETIKIQLNEINKYNREHKDIEISEGVNDPNITLYVRGEKIINQSDFEKMVGGRKNNKKTHNNRFRYFQKNNKKYSKKRRTKRVLTVNR